MSLDGRGWLALLGVDPDQGDRPLAGVFCPPCALREFDRAPVVPEFR